MNGTYTNTNRTETIDLTLHPGCYAHFLVQYIDEIDHKSVDFDTSLQKLKYRVLEIIEPAYFNARAKAQFIIRLMSCQSKVAIYKQCFMSIKNAENYAVTPKEKAEYDLLLLEVAETVA
jgi:hypothetical protein